MISLQLRGPRQIVEPRKYFFMHVIVFLWRVFFLFYFFSHRLGIRLNSLHPIASSSNCNQPFISKELLSCKLKVVLVNYYFSLFFSSFCLSPFCTKREIILAVMLADEVGFDVNSVDKILDNVGGSAG